VQHVKSATYQVTAAAADYDCGKHSHSTLYCGINCAFCNKSCPRVVGTLSFLNTFSLTKYMYRPTTHSFNFRHHNVSDHPSWIAYYISLADSGVAKGGWHWCMPPPVVVRVIFFKSSIFGSATIGYDTLLKFWSADYSLQPSVVKLCSFG